MTLLIINHLRSLKNPNKLYLRRIECDELPKIRRLFIIEFIRNGFFKQCTKKKIMSHVFYPSHCFIRLYILSENIEVCLY